MKSFCAINHGTVFRKITHDNDDRTTTMTNTDKS